MSKYIDCDKCYHGRVCAYRHQYHDMIVDCNHYKPTADVEEVKHGKWKVNVGMNFNKERICPICGKEIKGNYWNYCPHCGAKMDGGKEE